MRYRVDRTWRRAGDTVLAGSPLTMFRLSTSGGAVVDRLVAGDHVETSTLVDRMLEAGAIHPRPERSTMLEVADVTIVTPQLGGTVRFTERVVVDDGSVPPLAGASVRLATNRGPAAARNAGRREVDTALIAFVDADVDLPSQVTGGPTASDEGIARAWWEPLLAHFDDPRVGAVAPRVTGDPGSSLDLGPDPARVRQGTRVSYVPAAALVVRAEAFDDIGGFDEQMRFGEDVDFVWRLDQAGWRCRYEPAATVEHRRRATVRERLRQQYGYGSSSAPLALRHPRALAPFRSDGWTASSWLLALTGHPLVGLGLAGSRTWTMRRKLPDVAPATLLRLSMTNHVAAARQLTTTVRRAWWPLVAVAALASRRARRLAVVAVAAAPHRLVLDVAFGAGIWSSMLRLKDWKAITPSITLGPGRQRRR